MTSTAMTSTGMTSIGMTSIGPPGGHRVRIGVLVPAIISLALLAACRGGGHDSGAKAAPEGASVPTSPPTTSPPSTPSTPSTSSPGPAPAAVDPNAPEVNEAGDIPDDQVFVAYTPPSGRFTVKIPEGWARSEPGGAVVFTDKLNSIRLETVDAPTAPTAASVTQSELPAIRAAAQRFEGGAVKSVTRRSGPAVLATYRADAPADPVTGKVVHDDVERYEFWRGGTTAVLTLSGPQGADNVDPWRIVTDSFQWR